MKLKINFPVLDEPLPIEKRTILTIEDVTLFSSVVRHFYHYDVDNQLKIFDEKLKSLKASELLVVTDILGFDVNSSAMLRLIHSDIASQLNEKPEIKSMIEKMASTITDLISYECLENELDLEYDEITLLELIKALGVQIETQSDTIFDKCMEILQVYHYLSKKRLLVFVNCGSYLSKSEVEQLLEYIQLTNQTVLFLEPRRLYDFPQYTLDKDFFLLLENHN
ncbi:type II-A CRISPR-associated protein Csn2 [Streptococcus pluranimalium]|uniref:type II-A CRISPR-associated protein Csn2 n=1 Tax=Streptococcus pluranimalium TaxID=82348 RepID=UPI003F68EB85